MRAHAKNLKSNVRFSCGPFAESFLLQNGWLPRAATVCVRAHTRSETAVFNVDPVKLRLAIIVAMADGVTIANMRTLRKQH